MKDYVTKQELQKELQKELQSLKNDLGKDLRNDWREDIHNSIDKATTTIVADIGQAIQELGTMMSQRFDRLDGRLNKHAVAIDEHEGEISLLHKKYDSLADAANHRPA
ncbi:MAG: hypothetical protein ACR2FM_00790 [Candidatus Saccharimonadales bacterium]